MTPGTRTRARLGLAVAAVLAVVALAGCADEESSGEDTTTTTTAAEQTGSTEPADAEAALPTIADQWVRPVADVDAMDRTAIYMDITGGSEDDALVAAAVPSEVAGMTEVHETVAAGGEAHEGADGEGNEDGGMMTMREVERIDIPAGETVSLAPGGYHIMVMGVAEPLQPGDTVEVTLTFENAGEVVVTAEVREP